MKKYKDLGIAIKAYRVAANESSEDLSEAIESDRQFIEQVENGERRPSPEILEMIARHYTLREGEAKRLLELAGYTVNDFDLDLKTDIKIEDITKDLEVLVNPVFYTDTINVVTNQYGVVLNFVQSNGNEGKPIVVSRVGMSHEHARSVIEVLQRSLNRASGKKQQDEKPQNSR